MLQKGYRNIYLPQVFLYHYESKTRSYEDTPKKEDRRRREANILKSKWQYLIDRDPCYNPNLTLYREDYTLKL